MVTDGAGNQVAYHVYYPFGEEATSPTQDLERLKFTGHERDLNAQTGPNPAADDLDYMHARFCSPLTGRFLSVDRHIGSPRKPQSWNRYSYTSNNPLKLLDPNGLVELHFTFTTFIAAPTVTDPSFSGSRTFEGDNRTFNTRQDSFRTQQTFRVETEPAKAANPVLSQRNVAGRTVELNRDGTVKATGLASNVGSVTGKRDAQGNAVVSLVTDSKNPLVTGAPAINSMLTITASPSGSSISVQGTLDGYPSAVLQVTNEQGQTVNVIQFDPSEVGNGPFSLFPGIGDQQVSVQCSTNTSGQTNCNSGKK